MAKNKSFDNVAEGFFVSANEKTTSKVEPESNPDAEPATAIAPEPLLNLTTDTKKAGRPRAADLKEGESVFKTSIYLTKETAQKIDIYAIKQEMDRSEAIRRIIRSLDV